MPKTAIYAGSFDPITNGHLAVIEMALRGFAKIVILVATNADKADRYMFTAEERCDTVKKATARFGNAVEVVRFDDGFIAKYAKDHRISALIRGIRSVEDFESEAKIADGNSYMNPDLTTFAVFAPKSVELISSSFVKNYIFGPRGCFDELRHFIPNATMKALAKKALRLRWISFMKAFSTDDKDLRYQAGQLTSAYSTTGRIYHDAEHIVRGFDELMEYFDNVQLYFDDKTVLQLAWFFHDIIHDIHNAAANNEKLSADWARRVVKDKLSFGAKLPQQVSDAILATKHTNTDASEDNSAILADVDLAIFGQDAVTYDRYVAQIREEYAEFPESEFAEGRRAILDRFLARKRIYRTQYFYDKYEKIARDNLTREHQRY